MKRASAVMMAIAIGALVLTSRAWASGADLAPPFAAFVADGQPEPPLEEFVAGHLGLIEPGWDTVYLYVAYRHLAGPGFNPEEQKVMLAVFSEPPWPQPDFQAQTDWLTERAKIEGAPQLDSFDVFAPAGELDSYRNCHDDALRTATATLQSMVAKFGAASPQVRQWLDAQDIVFQNCPGSKNHPHIPVPLKSGTPFEQAQRAYQIACANFYGEEFDTAITMFKAIAADSASPWRTIAPYLVARATLRKATLSGEKNDDALLAQAEQQLKAIAAGKAPEDLKTSAQGLLGFVECRLHPEERHAEEVRALMRPGSARTLAQDWKDYRQCGKPRQEGDHPADDLDDWIAMFKTSQRNGGQAARIDSPDPPRDVSPWIDKWKRTGSNAWLVASLAEVSGSDPNAAELLKAAQRVTPTAPAFLTVEFHVDRILIEQGKTDEARARIDAIIAKRDALPRSVYNQFAWMRLKLARSLDEYLKYALRYPVALEGANFVAWAIDGKGFGQGLDDPSMRQFSAGPLLDGDSVDAMNAWLPLSLLKQIAHSPILPPPLRARVAPNVWVRSVLIGDFQTARELAPIVSDLVPELKPALDAWLVAKSADQARFEFTLTVLRNPGLRPFIEAGVGRLTPLGQLDNFRDNWWAARKPIASPLAQPTPSASPVAQAPVPKYPAFLSEAEKQSSDREWTTLAAIGGAEYLCTEAIRHAHTSPDDARAPEALYRCIGAVHLSQATSNCDALAESAFHLLHHEYPDSTWARKNHFWYRAGVLYYSPRFER